MKSTENNLVLVEYLIINKNQDTFCNSEESFLKFIDVDDAIKIDRAANTISLLLNQSKEEYFIVSYSLISNKIPDKEERFFKLSLSTKEKDKLKEFDMLTENLEKIIEKINPNIGINVLWNDIAKYYSIEGYKLLYRVENLMRRLITDFMLVNVGYDWTDEHIPKNVQERDKQLKSNVNYLHNTYFSDLEKILFDGQRTKELRDMGKLELLIQRYISEGKKEILVSELEGVISKSMWDKYFAEKSKIEAKKLKEYLNDLNLLRNKIAHNTHINRSELGKIQNLSEKIIKALELEIKELPEKILTEEEKNLQIENVKNNVPNPHKHVIRLSQLARKYNIGRNTIVGFLREKGYYIKGNPNEIIDEDMHELVKTNISELLVSKNDYSIEDKTYIIYPKRTF